MLMEMSRVYYGGIGHLESQVQLSIHENIEAGLFAENVFIETFFVETFLLKRLLKRFLLKTFKSQQTIQDHVAMSQITGNKWINRVANRHNRFFCICIYKP